MTIEDLVKAIERRGYEVRLFIRSGYEAYCLNIAIPNHSLDRDISLAELEAGRLTHGQMAEAFLYPLSDGWTHVQCRECNTVLLEKELLSIGIPERVFEPNYKPEPPTYAYSTIGSCRPCRHCPNCGTALNKETIKAFED